MSRFEKRGRYVVFHDDRGGANVTMHADGKPLPPAGGEHAPPHFAWLFEHPHELHFGQRFCFKTDDREIIGRVAQGDIRIEDPGFDYLAELSAPLSLRPPREAQGDHPAPARAAAASLEAIRARYGAVESGQGRPYETVLLPGESGPVHAVLSAMLPAARGAHEIVDVFVQPAGTASFEPLRSGHLPMHGRPIIVARRRDLAAAPRIVGIMLAKDEADAAPEVIPALAQWLDRLYFFAGDPATHAAILAAAPAGWAIPVAIPPQPHTDGLRQYLLEAARADAANERDLRPMWVMSVQGDEIYHDSLREHIMWAQAERATIQICQVATFVLHESQRSGWDWTRPLAQRFSHYAWDFGEHAGFLDFPWIWYDPAEHMRAHPHGMYPAAWAKARPVRRHYPFRTPEQATARIEDRLRSGWQPHYENYRDVFMRDQAAGRPVKRFFGWFPEAERAEGIW